LFNYLKFNKKMSILFLFNDLSIKHKIIDINQIFIILFHNMLNKIIIIKNQNNFFIFNGSKYQNKYHYFIIFLEKNHNKSII
jgi:hypothetical protein